jgi:2-C-methyl-D-erythritol 4-phosphate cytidylyltransferase
MGSDRNKCLLEICGQPMLAWTLKSALAAQEISGISIIAQPHDFPEFKSIIAHLEAQKTVHFVTGGSTRQESVYNGLQTVPPDVERVLIHDAARCLATPDLFDRCAIAAQEYSALIAAVPVKDTIKVVDEQGIIQDTPNRQNLWAAQTPQGFEVALLKQCHQQGKDLGWQVTDDAALLEKSQIPVRVVMGEETNIKLTTPDDLTLAEQILRRRWGSLNSAGFINNL